MIRWLLRRWREKQREIDLAQLWPAMKQEAPNLEIARAAFAEHCLSDTAWTRDYDAWRIETIVEALE